MHEMRDFIPILSFRKCLIIPTVEMIFDLAKCVSFQTFLLYIPQLVPLKTTMSFAFETSDRVIETDLGKVHGVHYDSINVTQYLGIPYATVPGRFRKSVVLEQWANGEHDGTKLGPMIPQIKRSFYPIPMFDRPWLNTPGADEFGLNLNISVPDNGESLGKLPVMVFIHGGANTYGAANACIYDGFQLAHNSLKLSEPTIIVTLNYRLGSFGFLASSDLQQYNEKFGEGVGNYGISDQRNALLWVKKYIKAFGGDSERITLFGQSAGSQASHLVLLQNEGLVYRVILQSGLAPLCSIFTVEQYDKVYYRLLDRLGIKYDTAEERVDALLKVDSQVLTQATEDLFDIQFVTMAYTDNGHILPKIPSWSEVGAKVEGVDAVMIGDCVNECLIWNCTYKDTTASEFIKILHKKCSSKSVADKLLNLYEVTPELTQPETFKIIESMTSDGMFLLPNYIFYQGNPDSFVYHFDQKSAYDNEWGGYAHHSLDNVYIWGLLKETLRPEDKKLSEEMTKVWIDFANGKTVWPKYKESRKAMVFGDDGRLGRLLSEEEDTNRTKKYQIWKEIIESGLVEEFGKVCEDICLNRTYDHGYI